MDKSNLNISSLKKLDVSSNNIKSWIYIHPSSLNLTKSILELDVSHNPLRNLSTGYLNSSSLEILRMKNCSLSNVPNLFLSELPNLKELIISENEHLKVFKQVDSSSLEVLDLSNCNLDDVNLSGFPNLQIAFLSGNRINKILPKHFRNPKLEKLDLSDNTIKQINLDSFTHLINLKSLNISMNVFIDLHRNTFSKNHLLKNLYISRTYLQKMVQFDIKSLQYLDLRINEIQEFNADSMLTMPSLETLMLGNNLISKLPLGIKSSSLVSLDLSNNRIIEIKNNSLNFLSKLRKLNLAGNKLTTLNPQYLPKDLLEINLEYNLWRCECYSTAFKEQNDFLIGPPGLTNANTLKCNSPENLSDLTWFEACGKIWYDLGHGYMKSDKAWLYVITIILVISVIFSTIMCVRRMYQIRVMREQAEMQRRRQEAQERINRLRMEQQRQIEAQQNAPDPRELVGPPSYHEAIRMPRLDGSYSSLVGSRPSLVASNPELSKRNQRDRSGNRTGKQKIRATKEENERRERRRRRRRRTAGSSEDVRDANDAPDDNEMNASGDETTRSMICVTRLESVEFHSEDEIRDRRPD